MSRDREPWRFLDQYRGSHFTGEWPTLPQLFRITTERYPDRRCFSIYEPDNLFLSYREAWTAIVAVARRLMRAGVKPGDLVAVTGKNSPEWTVAYLATLMAGATVVPLDYQLKSDEIVALMKFAGVRALFVDEEKYDELDPKNKLKLRERISLAKAKPNYIMEIVADERGPESVPAGEAPVDDLPGLTQTQEHDLAAILFTSGTTGNQKGVMLTHHNFVSDCFLAQEKMNILVDDVFYALLPLHHSYCMLAVFIEAISVGCEVVFAKKLVVNQILKDLNQGQVTMFLAIPMLFNKMLKGLMRGVREKGVVVYGIVRALMEISGAVKKTLGVNPGKVLFKGIRAKLSLDSNRICICGGGPLPSTTFKAFNQLGVDFVQGYGLTETSPILTLNPVDHYKEQSVGQVVVGVEMRIDQPDERGNGEIVVKGPMVMQGYYKNERATAEAFTEDGWLRTGDVGYLDHENYLYLTGRKKSMIVTEGGKNVFPEEIEDHFQLYDELEQIMVRGYLKNEQMRTEGIEALVYPNYEFFKTAGAAGEAATAEEIKARVDEIIAEVNRDLMPYKRIERIEILEEPMEMTTTKKVKRHKVG